MKKTLFKCSQGEKCGKKHGNLVRMRTAFSRLHLLTILGDVCPFYSQWKPGYDVQNLLMLNGVILDRGGGGVRELSSCLRQLMLHH